MSAQRVSTPSDSRPTRKLAVVLVLLAACPACQSLSNSRPDGRNFAGQRPPNPHAPVVAGPSAGHFHSATPHPMGHVAPAAYTAPAAYPGAVAPLGAMIPTGAVAQAAHRFTRPLPCPHCSPAPKPWETPICGLEMLGEFSDENEYLCDGGDEDPAVRVGENWAIRGLNSEDTIVHYDTVDGERKVSASNRACLYAPRFASVRKVTGVGLHEQHDRVAGVDRPVRVHNQEERLLATTVVQPLQPVRNLGIKSPNAFRERVQGIGVDQHLAAAGLERQFMPYENFEIIRRGQFDANEKLRLNNWLQAAITWTHDKGVQVVIDNEAAVEAASDSGTQGLHVYELPKGKPRVRIVKVASRDEAQPGDLVEFTIRFDNVGDQTVGNVTIVDNLTTRLEYVEGSADCNLAADFFTDANEGESLILRWEVKEPLKVGEGGLIRFQCRVR